MTKLLQQKRILSYLTILLAVASMATTWASPLEGWQASQIGGATLADGQLTIAPHVRASKEITLPDSMFSLTVTGEGLDKLGMISLSTGTTWEGEGGELVAAVPEGVYSITIWAGAGGAAVQDIQFTSYPVAATPSAVAVPTAESNWVAWSSLNAGLMLLSVGATVYVWKYAPTKVVERRTDPPPDAHYIRMARKEPDPTSEAAILFQKESEVFFHALLYCDGLCSTRQLEKALDKHWNDLYLDFPEYAKTWTIKRRFIEATLKKYDFTATGRVVQLTQKVGDGFLPEGYALLPQSVGGNVSRKLIPIRAMAELWIEAAIEPPPPLEVEEEAPTTATEELPDVGNYPMPAWALATEADLEEELELA